MQSFRERILENIHRFGTASVPDLSKILGISKPAVQYHIRHLLASGDIQLASADQSAHIRGRPTLYYQISENKNPNNYEKLCEALFLQILSAPVEQAELDHRLKVLANCLAGEVQMQPSFIKQINQAIQHLTAHHYQPHWEVASSGSEIRLHNCPYARLASVHPELCRMDALFLENLLGIPVQIRYLWRDHPEIKTGCSFSFKR